MSNRASLSKREENFVKKLKVKNYFSYISDYKGYKYPVKVKHNKCGNEIEVLAETILSSKKADDCIHCTTSIRNKSIRQIEEIIKEIHPNLKLIKKYNIKSKVYFVIQCNTCNHEYKVTYNQLKNKTFKCCGEHGSIYIKHLNRNVRQIIQAMRPSYLEGQSLYNYIEEFIEDLNYIKSKNIDKGQFIFDIYQEINYLYVKKKIAKCECCGEYKKGCEWGTYKNNYSNRICNSCLTQEKECFTCKETKKHKEFNFNYDTKNFDSECIECKKSQI